jgi:hypothetical protein
MPTKGAKNAGFMPISELISSCETPSRGIRTLSQSQHFSHPQPLAVIVTQHSSQQLHDKNFHNFGQKIAEL